MWEIPFSAWFRLCCAILEYIALRTKRERAPLQIPSDKNWRIIRSKIWNFLFGAVFAMVDEKKTVLSMESVLMTSFLNRLIVEISKHNEIYRQPKCARNIEYEIWIVFSEFIELWNQTSIEQQNILGSILNTWIIPCSIALLFLILRFCFNELIESDKWLLQLVHFCSIHQYFYFKFVRCAVGGILCCFSSITCSRYVLIFCMSATQPQYSHFITWSFYAF